MYVMMTYYVNVKTTVISNELELDRNNIRTSCDKTTYSNSPQRTELFTFPSRDKTQKQKRGSCDKTTDNNHARNSSLSKYNMTFHNIIC